MLVNDTIHANMAAYAYQPIRAHYANAAIWSTREPTANEVMLSPFSAVVHRPITTKYY